MELNTYKERFNKLRGPLGEDAMFKFNKAIFCVLIFCISIFSNTVFANDDIESFLFGCDPSKVYDLNLIFAPVEKLHEEQHSKEQWSYRYTNIPDIVYSEEQKKLPTDKALEVSQVSHP